jgi:hypothetical protein
MDEEVDQPSESGGVQGKLCDNNFITTLGTAASRAAVAIGRASIITPLSTLTKPDCVLSMSADKLRALDDGDLELLKLWAAIGFWSLNESTMFDHLCITECVEE